MAAGGRDRSARSRSRSQGALRPGRLRAGAVPARRCRPAPRPRRGRPRLGPAPHRPTRPAPARAAAPTSASSSPGRLAARLRPSAERPAPPAACRRRSRRRRPAWRSHTGRSEPPAAALLTSASIDVAGTTAHSPLGPGCRHRCRGAGWPAPARAAASRLATSCTVPQHLSQLGELDLEPARGIRPREPADCHLGAAVRPGDRADEDPAPPDQERQDQAGQRGEARDQGGQLAGS